MKNLTPALQVVQVTNMRYGGIHDICQNFILAYHASYWVKVTVNSQKMFNEKKEFYTTGGNFTLALLVMLVTNITSDLAIS